MAIQELCESIVEMSELKKFYLQSFKKEYIERHKEGNISKLQKSCRNLYCGGTAMEWCECVGGFQP